MAQGHEEQNTISEAVGFNKQGPVECFGMTFNSEEERRSYYLELLREKLKDPEFRKIEGFPIGSDEDILALSDPPYYTACPNPFIKDFIKNYGKPYDPNEPYSRKPFAADVAEGKNDPIYNAHSYHTKVPHKAIMRYILHYTDPGDVLFDGFCGTGMTGVAAQLCGNKKIVESLGYRVDVDGVVLQQQRGDYGEKVWVPFSKIGARYTALNDLSPAATFIAYNYNTPVDIDLFEAESNSILSEVEDECGWMYETMHVDGKEKGSINYIVWSDVFICPECTYETCFWESAVDIDAKKVKEVFYCNHCGSILNKNRMERSWGNNFDTSLKQTIRQAKQIPVLINYTCLGKRFEKTPDENDLAVITKTNNSEIPYWHPVERMIEGREGRRNDKTGKTHVQHFYTKRNLHVLSALFSKINPRQRLLFQSIAATLCSKLVRYNMGKRGNGPLAGTLYVSSLTAETNVIKAAYSKLNYIVKALCVKSNSLVQCQSFENLIMEPNTIDYIFVDPPFGSNLNYSELNFIWESWLRVFSNNKSEAIENATQNKGIDEYRHMMACCFHEAYRILKPGRWMTVVFSNTRSSVWNSIQTALAEAGFIVANVSALNKKQGSFKAVTTPTAVKQDLVISAYKPDVEFEKTFDKKALTEEGIWEFIRNHLRFLPLYKNSGDNKIANIAERDPRILYDQMLAYYVRRGYAVPLNSAEFQKGLAERFSYRDGMYFLSEQVAEYDKKLLTQPEFEQAKIFVSDETSAIVWLRQLLKNKPQLYQDILPHFIKELSGWQKHEKRLELSTLLEQNFLCYDGKGEVPNQIHSYLSTNYKELRNLPKSDQRLKSKGKNRWYVPDPNKAGDLEKLRERSLLKEFEEYRLSNKKRLKEFRLEAVRAGFKKAWQERDYDTIIAVAEKIPDDTLQEDPKLLMWYDQALTRSGDE